MKRTDFTFSTFGMQIFCILLINFTFNATAQKIFIPGNQIISYSNLPTWTGIASNWKNDNPTLHIYDYNIYQGHADFVSKGLKTGITFQQFKQKVVDYNSREYLPFFIFDFSKNPLIIKNKKYQWALRLEDYQYNDTPEQMTSTILKLMNSTSALMRKETNDQVSGIIILSKNPQSQPNISIAAKMEEKGYPYLTIPQLLERTGGAKIQILNEGIAYGYLKKGNKSENFTFKDIVIFDDLPVRVPPVGGIITLKPQTPLSHVNLLAKNRGTINLYTSDINNISKIGDLMGKLVYINCNNLKIIIREASINEAEKYWKKRTDLHIVIPKPELFVDEIIDFKINDQKKLQTSCIGAKASNYAILQHEFPTYVKAGYAIPFSYYFDMMKKSGIDKIAEELLIEKTKLTKEQVSMKLKKIQEMILSAEIDSKLIEELRKLIIEKFGGNKIRLRSSTNCEDLPDFNGAGLYTSVGFKSSGDNIKLKGKILEVYASLWNANAFEEREFYGIQHSEVGMAILINEAFTEEAANGVSLTIPTKDGLMVYINSQSGENAITNPEGSAVPEAILFPDATSNNFKIESKSTITDVFIKPEWKSLLYELKGLTLKIHTLFNQKGNLSAQKGYGVDIEFKIMKTDSGFQLNIKQARLLGTSLPQ